MTQAPEGAQPKWKGKGKEIIRKPVPTKTSVIDDDTEEDEDPVDWTQYEPPEGLKDAYDVTSDIIQNLLKESIDRVKARIVEESVRKTEEEAFKLEEDGTKGKGVETGQTEDEAPQVAQQEQSTDGSLSDAMTPVSETSHRQLGSASVNFAGTRLTIDQHGLLRPAPVPSKLFKRSLLGFLRRLNNGDKAESSSAAASRTRKINSASSLDLDARLNALLAGKRHGQGVRNESTPESSADSSSSECVSCLDDFDPNEMVKAPCHNYCQDCFTRLITSACEHEQHWPPKCCLNTIPEPTNLTLTDEDLKQRYRSRAEEWNLPVSERVYCHQPECSAWLRPAQIDRALNTARCTAGHSTCTLCRGAQHENLNADGHGTCPQDRDVQRTAQLAEEAGWRRCPGCHAYVEHSDACQHMTCRCGAQFCYVCGARWRTCNCTMAQLATIKAAGRRRQEQRALRQARDESEAAEAVRQVAEFEREEARKAELLRRERERRDVERRRCELEARIAREEARRAAVEVKFAGLRDALEELHVLQHIGIAQGLERRAAVRQHEAQVARAALGEKNNAAREKLHADAVAKLTACEKALDGELAARIKEERRVEDQYLAQLQAHYRPGADAVVARADREIEKSMKALRRRNDEGFAAWRKWKDGEWETYQYRVLEGRDLRLESLDVAETRLDESAERGARGWVDVVVEVRQKMLAEMETDETENGGEDIAEWLAEQEAIVAVALEDSTPPPPGPSSPSSSSGPNRPVPGSVSPLQRPGTPVPPPWSI
ncbi:hypothetical protein PG994_012388 [Apiospora phragmitis]|uniref:RBR-type E3 ubiquitin transferase n=1 Tax=Apiospora phragmitis TaxID=2905665 RepID=A0ABR1TY75_9PEZI